MVILVFEKGLGVLSFGIYMYHGMFLCKVLYIHHLGTKGVGIIGESS